MNKLPFGEDIGHYWRTSKKDAGYWLNSVRDMIVSIPGCKVLKKVDYEENDQNFFLVEFTVGLDWFKIIYPVLPVRQLKDREAARVQAVTLMFHEVKSRMMLIKIFGIHYAFLNYLVADNGKTVSQMAVPELAKLPILLDAPRQPQLNSGDEIVEGEYKHG